MMIEKITDLPIDAPTVIKRKVTISIWRGPYFAPIYGYLLLSKNFPGVTVLKLSRL